MAADAFSVSSFVVSATSTLFCKMASVFWPVPNLFQKAFASRPMITTKVALAIDLFREIPVIARGEAKKTPKSPRNARKVTSDHHEKETGDGGRGGEEMLFMSTI